MNRQFESPETISRRTAEAWDGYWQRNPSGARTIAEATTTKGSRTENAMILLGGGVVVALAMVAGVLDDIARWIRRLRR